MKKATVLFDGEKIKMAKNVTSVTHQGVGHYTVNFKPKVFQRGFIRRVWFKLRLLFTKSKVEVSSQLVDTEYNYINETLNKIDRNKKE